MKKTYTKPQIAFESFIMSTNIAGDCEAPYMDTFSKNTCGVPESVTIPGETPLILFSMGVSSNCTAPGTGTEIYNGLCYDNPSADANLFNS